MKIQSINPSRPQAFLRMTFALVLLLILPATATYATTSVADGSWDDGATWNSGVPDAGDDAYIVGGDHVTVGVGVTAETAAVHTGFDGNGTLTISGGTLTSGQGDIGRGNGADSPNGLIEFTSGTWNNNGVLYIGMNGSGFSGTGTLNMSGGVLTSTSILSVGQGDSSTGTLLLSSGTLNANSSAKVGDLAGSSGFGTISGGSMNVTSNLIVGNLGTGTLNIDGGAVTANTATTFLGLSADSEGTLNLTGGTLTTARITLGNDASATATLNLGGTVSGGGTVGTLSATEITSKGISAINFNNSGNYSFGTNSSGTLKVNQVGSGTTTITNANTYTGGTIVSLGTLLVSNGSGSATGSGTVTVQSGGTLGGDGIISGAVTVKSDGKLAPGTSPGLLTTGNLTLESGSESLFEINGTNRGVSFDAIDVNGTMVYGGTLTVDFGFTPLETDTFDLFDFTTQSGTFSAINFVDPGYGGTFDYATGVLSLSAIPEPQTWMLILPALAFLFAGRRKRAA